MPHCSFRLFWGVFIVLGDIFIAIPKKIKIILFQHFAYLYQFLKFTMCIKI